MTSPLLKEVKKRERRRLYTWDEIEADVLGGVCLVIGMFGAIAYMILGGGL